MFGVTRTRSATATDTVAEVKADDAVLIKKRKPAPGSRCMIWLDGGYTSPNA
jgi:hypothetical protein